MKFSFVILGFFALFALTNAAANLDPNDKEMRMCVPATPAPLCDEVVQSVVIQHYGDDYQAGDMLNDQITELMNEEGTTCRREILLKCKHAGCKFFLSATVEIATLAGDGGIKIRGLLKDGRRPIIWNTGPININVVAGIVEFEKVNFQADGFSSSQSNIVINTSAMGALVLIDECDFIGHSAGYSRGGAILIQTGNVKITSSKFINNAAEEGGAIAVDATVTCVNIFDTSFVDNAAIEKGGAIHNLSTASERVAVLGFIGCHFKGNTANKKGDTFVGEGGAIYTEGSIVLIETRSHGGNSAQFGNFLYATATSETGIRVDGFGCYEGPYRNQYVTGTRGDYESYDSYHAYPVCSADSYDSYAPREDFYLDENILLLVSRIDLPGGVICGETGAISTIARFECGSYVQSYHCKFDGLDKPIEAEDYDRDGFDCRYDCNDLWDTVNPAASEQCNDTDSTAQFPQNFIGLVNPRGYELHWLSGDSNCNGLQDEFVDTDGDWVPDDSDGCPLDYWKIDPGHCGCGIEETDGCASADSECGTTEYGGVWYYMCEGQWWYWGENDWTYGGTY